MTEISIRFEVIVYKFTKYAKCEVRNERTQC